MNGLWILGIMLFGGGLFAYDWLKRYSSMPQTIEATIIDKNEYRKVIHIPRRVVTYDYTLIFEYEGKQVTLFCDGNDYERFEIGDQGKVTFSGEMMLKFEKS